MIRILSLAALVAAGFALPALAADQPAADAKLAAAASAELASAANAEQARKLLLAQGYTNVSQLTRDESGKWTGTAMKDGKTNFVAINLPHPQADAPKAN